MHSIVRLQGRCPRRKFHKPHTTKMSSFYRIAAVVVSSGSLSALLLAQKDRFRVYASSQGEQQPTGAAWDYNWDRRQPEEGKEEGKESPPKSTATRYLILIRHGQYEQWHSEQEKKVLTEIGRQQALATGQQALATGQQALATGQQALATGQQQALATGQQQALATGQQLVLAIGQQQLFQLMLSR